MSEEGRPGAPFQVVTVKTDRVVTLTTSLGLEGSVPHVTMHAERKHKEAWRRLAHQPGVSLGPVIDMKAWSIVLEALRRIARLEAPHEDPATAAREALFKIGDRSVAPLDETDVP
jgi:hypothetical protein